ncbi:MAG TPA: hypothetical protein DC046_06510 [Rhodospirillaceae bacterium]|nr:hypothetical protein [Rhodospirillaceae bacterium]
MFRLWVSTNCTKAKLARRVKVAKRTANREVTSKRAASAASKVLRDPRSSKAAKTAAGSALTQRPNRSPSKGK